MTTNPAPTKSKVSRMEFIEAAMRHFQNKVDEGELRFYLEVILYTLGKELAAGRQVVFNRFGAFRVDDVRRGRFPSDKMVPKTVRFKPSGELRKSL